MPQKIKIKMRLRFRPHCVTLIKDTHTATFFEKHPIKKKEKCADRIDPSEEEKNKIDMH